MNDHDTLAADRREDERREAEARSRGKLTFYGLRQLAEAAGPEVVGVRDLYFHNRAYEGRLHWLGFRLFLSATFAFPENTLTAPLVRLRAPAPPSGATASDVARVYHDEDKGWSSAEWDGRTGPKPAWWDRAIAPALETGNLLHILPVLYRAAKWDVRP